MNQIKIASTADIGIAIYRNSQTQEYAVFLTKNRFQGDTERIYYAKTRIGLLWLVLKLFRVN